MDASKTLQSLCLRLELFFREGHMKLYFTVPIQSVFISGLFVLFSKRIKLTVMDVRHMLDFFLYMLGIKINCGLSFEFQQFQLKCNSLQQFVQSSLIYVWFIMLIISTHQEIIKWLMSTFVCIQVQQQGQIWFWLFLRIYLFIFSF